MNFNVQTLFKILLAFAILSQIPHAAEVFRLSYKAPVSEFMKTVHCYLYASVFEVSLLSFVLLGRKWISWIFCIISVLTNLIYYQIFEIFNQYAALIISIQLPLVIALYSHEFFRVQNNEPVMDDLATTTATTQQTWQETVEKPVVDAVEIVVETKTNTPKKVPGIVRQKKLYERVCQLCGKEFQSSRPDTKFCSSAHRARFHEKNHKLKIENEN